MKAAPMTQKPSFPLMKQGDVQNIYHLQMPRWLFTDTKYMERLFYSDSFRIGKAVLPRSNVRSRLWDLDGIILQSVQSKLAANQRDVKNSTAYTMAVIFNTICESHSDLLVDPYLNSLGGPPAGR